MILLLCLSAEIIGVLPCAWRPHEIHSSRSLVKIWEFQMRSPEAISVKSLVGREDLRNDYFLKVLN